MAFLENAMKEDIDDSVRFRFIPYIQLHEFEGLLFNNIDTFRRNIPENEFTVRKPNCPSLISSSKICDGFRLIAEHLAFSIERFAVMGDAPSMRFMANNVPVSSTTAILTLNF